MGPAGLEDAVELAGFAPEGARELAESGGEPALEKLERREPHGRGIDVVRALAHVHMVVRVDDPVPPFPPAEDLFGAVGEDLVHIHVERRPRAHLEDVDGELVVALPGQDLVAGRDDGRGPLPVEEAEPAVGPGGRLLDAGHGHDEDGGRAEPADRKVLDRPLGLDPVIGGCGNGLPAERVLFEPHADAGMRGHRSPPLTIKPAPRLKINSIRFRGRRTRATDRGRKSPPPIFYFTRMG